MLHGAVLHVVCIYAKIDAFKLIYTFCAIVTMKEKQ